MEKFTEKTSQKNQEKFKKLKEIKDDLENSNIKSNEVKKLLNELIKFEDLTSKDINNLKIAKLLKSLWQGSNKEIACLSNELIIKWRKITKLTNEDNVLKKHNLDDKKNENCKNSKEFIQNFSKLKNLDSYDNYDIKVEEIKKKIIAECESSNLISFRKTTKILIFENISKISKDKFLSFIKNKEWNDYESLKQYTSEKLDFIKELSNNIEIELNEIYSELKDKYIRKTKSILSNIRINNELYEALFESKLTPAELVRMEDKDMASNEIKQFRQKKEEESFNSRRSDWNRIHNTFVSGMYRCGKCRGNKTTYYQVQIRRADEPMTTFVTCLDCNNNWKC